MNESFDHQAALDTLRLLRLAHDRWHEMYANLAGMRFSDANGRNEVSLLLRGPAVETIMWARSLDDWCRGLPENKKPTQPVLPGYQTQRPHSEGLLDAARYATNRSLHQLLALMIPWGTMRFPLKISDIFDTFSGVRWLPECRLRPAELEKQGQRTFRTQYVKHMAGQEVGPVLDRLRGWFESVLVPTAHAGS